MDDAEIVDLYVKRSECAIKEADKKYGRCCYAIAWDILKNHEYVDECIADMHYKTWMAIPDIRPKELGQFMEKIVRNCALDILRKLCVEKRMADHAALLIGEFEERISDKLTLDLLIEMRETNRAIYAFVKELPETQQAIFIQRYWCMCSIAEIAENLGISKTCVSSSLCRIRVHLKAVLIKEEICL